MEQTVMLGHGSGGIMMKRLIDEIFLKAYAGKSLKTGDDAAVLAVENHSISFSTDSYVVSPHFFPGGNIGKLAVCGTVNDVATSGAVPKWISCSFVLEEGFSIESLKEICETMAEVASEAGVEIVTGDTKVVERGSGDGIFINTSGIGLLDEGVHCSGSMCRPGDKILLSGSIGDHGVCIMSARQNLNFNANVTTDAAPLNHMIADVLAAAPNTRCFRDPTRGGLSSTLNELASQSKCDFIIEEQSVVVKPAVEGACEMLGLDVFQVANEGKMVSVVPAEEAQAALLAMQKSKYGAEAAIIGEVVEKKENRDANVSLVTRFGSKLLLDVLVGEQLPRIC